jgi:hypothetical protein
MKKASPASTAASGSRHHGAFEPIVVGNATLAERCIWNQHGLAVLCDDRLVLERYFESEDHVRGIDARPAGCSP